MAAERIATDTHGYHADALAEELARIDHVARHLTVGGQVSPADRHNVGTVTALDDAAGHATVRFVSTDGHEATRRFDWADLRLIDRQRRAPPAGGRPAATRHHHPRPHPPHRALAENPANSISKTDASRPRRIRLHLSIG